MGIKFSSVGNRSLGITTAGSLIKYYNVCKIFLPQLQSWLAIKVLFGVFVKNQICLNR